MEESTPQFTERQKGVFNLFWGAVEITEYGERLSIICVEWLARHIEKELKKEGISCHVRDEAITGSGNNHSEITIHDEKRKVEIFLHRVVTDIVLHHELSKKAFF